MSHRLTRRVLLGSAAAVPATTFITAPATAVGPRDLSTRLLEESAPIH
ncbi:hypothetical protein EV652_114126 [Kribbella steppae]|uniref:Uncharacterized protein n=1 Tax=Kribbella steppae TaxID=2512223 RepID=A0A4R2H2C6_9ACTN|nr:hypothetical protein [Kribbella steppae]TCO19147.1 hypothetical protein EV652_114126 [Kribbella steppae]